MSAEARGSADDTKGESSEPGSSLPDSRAALFAYGELCRATVLLEILRRVPVSVPALLLEHRRRRNEATGYYEAYASSGGYVAGLLFQGLERSELDRLDAFERVADGLYRRTVARVRLMQDGHPEMDAWVYAGGEG